jgi:cysteine desulfurase
MMTEIGALRGRLETGLDGVEIFARDAERLPNTVCFAVPGLDAETLLMNLDLDGIAVSSGSACSSGKVAKSHVLAAMGAAPELAKGAIRVSLGWNTTEEDIDRLIAVMTKLRARLAPRAAA